MTQPRDVTRDVADASLPEPTKPLVRGAKVGPDQWEYEVIHEGVISRRVPWREAYERARGIAVIQAMVHNTLGGALRG